MRTTGADLGRRSAGGGRAPDPIGPTSPQSARDGAVGVGETPTVKTAQEVVSIQGLRAVAALMVVFHHAHEQFPTFARLLPVNAGASGVDLFFVISGFVMTYTTGLKSYGALGFLERRLIRIAPLYYILTGFTALLLVSAPSLVHDSIFTPSSLVFSLLFWPQLNPGGDGGVEPMLKLGWTLNFEVFFYVTFALFLRLSVGRRVVAMTMVLGLLVASAGFLHPAEAPLSFWGRPVILEFALGCWVGLLDLKGWLSKIASPVFVCLIGLGVAGLLVFDDVDLSGRVVSRGAPALAVVLGTVGLERRGRVVTARPLLFLGDASYSIYLAHLYAVVFFRLIWTKLHLDTSTIISAIVFVGACVVTGAAGGCLCHVLVERPLTRRVRGWAEHLRSASR